MSIKKRGIITLALAGLLVPILSNYLPVFVPILDSIASGFIVTGQGILLIICSVILGVYFNVHNEIRKKTPVVRIVYFIVVTLICFIASYVTIMIRFMVWILFGF